MLKRILGTLYFQVIFAITLGVVLGVFAPAAGILMKPLGDGYVKLIRMIIAPLIFCTLVLGIAGANTMKKSELPVVSPYFTSRAQALWRSSSAA